MKETLFRLATTHPRTSFTYEVHTDDDGIVDVEKIFLIYKDKMVYCRFKNGNFFSLEGWYKEKEKVFSSVDEMSQFLWGE